MSRTPPLYDAEIRQLKEAEEALYVAMTYAVRYRMDGERRGIAEKIKEIQVRRRRLESGG